MSAAPRRITASQTRSDKPLSGIVDNAKQVPGRMPPQNIDAEISTLGALLLDPEAIIRVADTLSPLDFYRPDLATIYEAMIVLFEKRIPPDLVTVADELARVKKLEEVGGPAALSTLVSSIATASNVQHYAGIVREKAMLRRLIHAASKIGELGFQEELSSDIVLDQAEQTLFEVTQRFLEQNFVPVRNVLTESFERLDELSKQEGTMRGLPTGFRHLDNILGGLQKSDLIIIAARPSMGKSTFSTCIAEHVAIHEKKTVGIFSLEMSKEQLVDRLISSIGLIDSWKLRNGRLTDEDFRNLNEAYGILAEANIFIDDAASLNVMEIRAKSRRLQAEHGLDLIIVDYLQLMAGTYNSRENRVQEVSEISRSLKALARELYCPVIAISQLSRAVESRPDKHPMLSDLRDSGCLAGDTLITRADTGERVKIKDLVDQTDVPVWSMDDNYRIVKKTASRVFSSGFKQIFELEFRSGRKIKASANHQFRSYLQWKRLDELEVGEKLAMPRAYNGHLPDNVYYSDSLLIFFAHMLGDGCYVPNQPIHYTSADLLNIKAVKQAANELYGIKGRVVPQKKWYHLYLPCPYHLTHRKHHPFINFLREQELSLAHSFEKVLPDSLFSCSDRQLYLFLHHLWSTDGCISLPKKKGGVSIYYATSSKTLAEQVQYLLLRLGVQSRLSSVAQNKKGKTFRPSYHIEIQGKDNQELFLKGVGCHGERGQKIPLCLDILSQVKSNPNTDTIDKSIWQSVIIPAKIKEGISWRSFQAELGTSYSGSSIFKHGLSRERLSRVAQVVHDPVLTNIARSDIYWDEVISVNPLLVEEVYDATVPETHNFIANDIIVHNSIEQDSDVVIFLYREDYYNKEDQNHIMEILVRKHRNGPTGDAKVISRLQFSRFDTLDIQHSAP